MSRMRRAFAGLSAGLLILVSQMAAADGRTGELMRVLRVEEVIAVMRDEGLVFGKELEADWLDGDGGSRFETRIDQIYDADGMFRIVEKGIGRVMTDEDIAATIAFFDTERGQRILTLETSARRAMADEQIEEMARENFFDLRGSKDAHYLAVSRFIEVNDLLERNVAGALSSQYDFFRGLSDGGGSTLDEASVLSDIWAQEEEVRDDTRAWLFGFLLMAYRPLGDTELEAYTAYSETDAGRALNAALFEGFDAMFQVISYALGQAVAEAVGSSEL